MLPIGTTSLVFQLLSKQNKSICTKVHKDPKACMPFILEQLLHLECLELFKHAFLNKTLLTYQKSLCLGK